MVKIVSSTSHRGLTDWAIQRISAILIAIYSIGLMAYFLSHSDLTHYQWRMLFTHQWMKIASVIFLFALLYHAWIGMWTIFTDYIKPFILRALIEIIVLLLLVASFVWGVITLWSV